jgi:ATP-binding cassette, subfamily C (CFTR/MRP), member 1
MCAATISNVLGAVILITVLTHYFVVAVAVILVFYCEHKCFLNSPLKRY